MPNRRGKKNMSVQNGKVPPAGLSHQEWATLTKEEQVFFHGMTDIRKGYKELPEMREAEKAIYEKAFSDALEDPNNPKDASYFSAMAAADRAKAENVAADDELPTRSEAQPRPAVVHAVHTPYTLAKRAVEIREEAESRGEPMTGVESVVKAYKEAGVPLS
jgi:hypothetical protein